MVPVHRATLFIGAWGGVDFGLRFTRCDLSPACERKFATRMGSFVILTTQHARAIQTNSSNRASNIQRLLGSRYSG
jgi:hypothetical protein